MLERYFLSNATTDNSNTVGSFQGFNDLLREKISINITLRNRNMRERAIKLDRFLVIFLEKMFSWFGNEKL